MLFPEIIGKPGNDTFVGGCVVKAAADIHVEDHGKRRFGLEAFGKWFEDEFGVVEGVAGEEDLRLGFLEQGLDYRLCRSGGNARDIGPGNYDIRLGLVIDFSLFGGADGFQQNGALRFVKSVLSEGCESGGDDGRAVANEAGNGNR